MTKFQVVISQTAKKQIAKLSQKDQKRILNKIDALAEQPFPRGAKRLSGEPTFRVRVGDYRIIYDVDGKRLTVLVLVVGKRSDIYKRL